MFRLLGFALVLTLVPTVFGRKGKDVLIGFAGADYVCGEGGDDILLGEASNDRLLGGGAERGRTC